jgi:hypothetical protein
MNSTTPSLPSPRRRGVTSLAAGFFAAAVSTAALPAEDMRTIGIRVVPEQAWTAQPGPIAVVTSNASDHEKAPAFADDLKKWVVVGFQELGYEVRDDADTRFTATLEIFDPGSAAKRFGLGFGAGTSHVEGTVVVEQGGEVVGRYRFSARPKGIGTDFPAKEVGPPLVLQISQGVADEALHVYEKAEKGKKKKGAAETSR